LTEVRNPQRKLAPDTVGLEQREPTSLWDIAKRAKACKDHRFQDLYRMLDASLLLGCWDDLNKRSASGVDKVTAADYEQDLIGNILRLEERLKAKTYRAKLVRRVYIPKENGGERPLGIPALEDKLVQLACAKILGAIYEQDFLPVSYGYRPDVGARDAVLDLGFNLQYGKFGYVAEADIKNFFGNLNHDLLLDMLSQRIDDRAFLNLIRKWLKAGILDTDGAILHPETGTPQGGIVSPILSNVYLHHVLDRWFEETVKVRCRGQAIMIRYADDFVCAFQYQKDARRFFEAMPKAAGEIRPGGCPGEDPYPAVQPLSPWAAQPVCISRIRAILEPRLPWRAAGDEAYCAQEAAECEKTDEGVDQGETPSGSDGFHENLEPQTGWALQLLWSTQQRTLPGRLLRLYDQERLQVAQSTGREAAQFQLGDVSSRAGEIQYRPTSRD